MWMYLGLLAALFLGVHNLCKKHAVQGNEVFPVLLGTISRGFLLVALFYVLAIFYPDYALENDYNFQQISWQIHGFIFIKSVIMAASWTLAYQALKHLPITIVTPIRSAGPFLPLLALLLFIKKVLIYING